MTPVDLSFSVSGGKYKASFTSVGTPTAVQLKQATRGTLAFYASVGSMTPIPIKVSAKWEHGLDFITSVNVPESTLVTIESETNVSGQYVY